MNKSKLTTVQYANIIAITLATMQEYTDFCLRCAKDDKTSNSVMYLEDVLHMQRALNAFISNSNVRQLQNNITMQDTFVREYYINTLRYIEDNNLLAEYNYC
jgi:tellurite resistance protein